MHLRALQNFYPDKIPDGTIRTQFNRCQWISILGEDHVRKNYSTENLFWTIISKQAIETDWRSNLSNRSIWFVQIAWVHLKSLFLLVLRARPLIGSRFILVHGLEIDEEPKVFRCCPEIIKTEVPEINFDVLPHNFCNHRRSMTNEKYHSVSFIILDRIDYLSRRTYRPLIEDQYKQLRTVFLDF